MDNTGAKWIAATIFGTGFMFFLLGNLGHKYQFLLGPGNVTVFRLNKNSGEVTLCMPGAKTTTGATSYSC